MRGKFLVLEGTEGTGKSTNLEFISQKINAAGIELVVTREPGGTPLAEEIREVLLTPREEKVDAIAELLLIFAARAQHINQVIRPALEAGKWVLSDRFTDATFAYQGGGRKLPKDVILELETMVQKELQPDLVFYLDIDVEIGLQRARARADLDRFEQEEIAFFEDVRAAYLARIAAAPERYYRVDASQALDKVQYAISKKLDEILAVSKAG